MMTQLTGIRFKGRQVRCNEEDSTAKTVPNNKKEHLNKFTKNSPNAGERKKRPFHRENDDWRSLMGKAPRELKGEDPDFFAEQSGKAERSEEGWARRRPKKK